MKKPPKKLKKVYGVGINDADYVVQPTRPDGKRSICPYYLAWLNMLTRAYSPKSHARRPTYSGVTACEEWHSFMAVRAWMETQDWQGKQLDKDIIAPGNKVYSPDTCVFVSPALNTLLTDSAAARGEWPIGVSWRKDHKKFQAYIEEGGKQRHLGYFTCPQEAHMAWRNAKVSLVREAAYDQADIRIKRGLLLHAARIERGEAH